MTQASEITQVTFNGNSQDTALWIWENLVPARGKAPSLQGEVLRVIEALCFEAQCNGNLNWDSQFDGYIAFLRRAYLTDAYPMAAFFTAHDKDKISQDIDRLATFILPTQLDSRVYTEELPYIEEDLYNRLIAQLVRYCRFAPALVPLVE
ncbi:hypothetical protein [Shewanella waksmanii]|uniref:hypothetical protein n=1 Tax=Shewanella waksmanii TaxID=213783 RepID=UPI0037367DA1